MDELTDAYNLYKAIQVLIEEAQANGVSEEKIEEVLQHHLDELTKEEGVHEKRQSISDEDLRNLLKDIESDVETESENEGEFTL
ncbi:MAG: hypothetical protein SV377_05245 [Halobacteria archaeon]|nr:hypothetical protein [Halobacteria archaeon]